MTTERLEFIKNYTEQIGHATLPKDEILELIEVYEAQRWIPVTERLPEESGCYLVVISDNEDEERSFVINAWFNTTVFKIPGKHLDLGWTLLYEFYDLTPQLREMITHWKPLPQPPKEEN